MYKLYPIILSSIFVVSCKASDEQIEAWIKKNPDKVIAALTEHQRTQQEANRPKPAMVKENEAALFNESSPSLGKGPLKIAYFFDFNCGHCVRQSETNANVLAKSDKVQIFYKNLPVLGPSSELAAKAALAAHQQNKFHEFYSEALKVREKNPESLKAIAKKIKLDMKKWEADMNGEAVQNEVQSVRTLASTMKINGTPFLAIAPDKVYPGRVDQLLEIVQAAP